MIDPAELNRILGELADGKLAVEEAARLIDDLDRPLKREQLPLRSYTTHLSAAGDRQGRYPTRPNRTPMPHSPTALILGMDSSTSR